MEFKRFFSNGCCHHCFYFLHQIEKEIVYFVLWLCAYLKKTPSECVMKAKDPKIKRKINIEKK